jgi:hypothetical protein
VSIFHKCGPEGADGDLSSKPEVLITEVTIITLRNDIANPKQHLFLAFPVLFIFFFLFKKKILTEEK